MKTLILIASMFFACLQGAKSQGSPPQRFVPPVNSVPIFLDSAKLKMDIRKLDILKEIYMKLERKKIGMVYSYGFEIDTNGKADLKWPDKNPRLMKINPFVEEMLKTYRWTPSHRLKCISCLIRRNADLTIIFMTNEKYIYYKLEISEEGGVGKKLFPDRINMK